MPKYDVKQVVRVLNYPGNWGIEDYIEQDNSYVYSMYNEDDTLFMIDESQLTALTLVPVMDQTNMKYEIKDGFVQVPLDMFQAMEKDVQLLYALQCAGVDTWPGYETALRINAENRR